MAKKLTQKKAKEILHDKSVHGHPLTDKQRKFFGAIAGGAPIKAEKGGWLDKYSEGGAESRMGGLTDIPFKYNSAWGGQFQEGGAIGTRPEDESIRDIDAFEKQYTNSPRFAYLSQKQGDSPEMTQKRRDIINNFNVDEDIIRIPEGVSYIGDEDNNNSPEFYLSPDAGDWPSYSDINAHEIGHLPYNTGNLNFPKKTYDEIQARNIEFQKKKASGKTDDNIEHDISPNEVRADKNQLLYQLKKLGIYDATKDGDITPKQLEEFKKSGEWNRLHRLYSDEDIIWLINNVAQNNPNSVENTTAAMGASIPGSVGFTYARTAGAAPSNGPYAKKTKASAKNGSMTYYQNGLDFKPRMISRDGNVVKDDNGYWNPDNWGEVVEIDSPDITMRGVNQPLLGISDEGDVQYMEPDRKSTRLNSSHVSESRMPSSA